MKCVVLIQVALLFVQLVNSGHLVDESPVICESTLERCINTDCLENNTVLDEIKQELCDIQDTECTDNPCQNGGTCINVTDTPVCQCPAEFVGKVCELNCTVEYETVGVLLNVLALSIFDENLEVNSKEECDLACTGECTASASALTPAGDRLCILFRAPVFSVTLVLPPVVIESSAAECKSKCTSQNSCRSYLPDFLSTGGFCFTFTVSATDLPVLPTGDRADILNKIKKCDISP